MNTQETILAQDLAGLSSAEDFLKNLGLRYDAHVVSVNRLHILKRFNVYLSALGALETMNVDERKTLYRAALERAYNDFVTSNAQAEKVFPIFRRGEPTFVALSAIERPRK